MFAAAFLLAAGAARAGVDISTASDTNGRVVVELANSDPPNFSPLVSFFTAISHAGSYSARFYAGPAPSTDAPAAPVVPVAIDTVTVSPPVLYRGARLLWVRVRIPQGVKQSHVVVEYTPATTFNNAAGADPLVRSMVANRSVFPVAPRAAATDPWFSLASGWAKLTVSERGVYAVTGADLSGAGFSLAAIDPASLRVYTQGGLNQAREYSDPLGSWRAGAAMREVAVLVEGGGDGTFDPGDRVVFYGVGVRDWADYYDATAPDSAWHEHTHARTNYYFLAWGGALPGSPLRMADAGAAPVAAADVTTYLHREYRERDLLADFDFRGDGWLWLDIDRPGANRIGLAAVEARNLVASQPQQFLSVGLSPYESGVNPNGHHAVYLNFRAGAEVTVGDRVWNTLPGQNYYEDGAPVRISGNFLAEGTNQFRLQVPGDLNPQDKMYFAWFAVWYQRRIVASSDAAGFTSPDTSGTVNFRATGFGTSGAISAFDVTDPWRPVRLTGAEVTASGSSRTVRLSAAHDGARRHFWVAAAGGLRRPAVARLTAPDLRAGSDGPNLLIVCDPDFRAAAERMRAHRAGRLPLYASPSVRVATTDEIYDNFSGGMPDPMAVRNYVKFLYDNQPDAHGNPRLAYVLLLGDATEDFQNYASTQPDFVPSNLYFTRATLFAFSTDEWFGHMDATDQLPGQGVLDIALGRLPAASAEEAQFLVDKVIGYETAAPLDPWRGRMILVADDENSSYEFACETQWTEESEIAARFMAPNYLDIGKIYLTEYPAIAGVKPQSRAEFLQEWNQGAVLINYIGHGSSQQMADEQVFLGSDVSQLVNGLKLPLLMAFSCTIGDFANPAGKSLSEKLLLREGGGVIGTVTASRETYPNPNERVAFSLFQTLFPPHLDQARVPVGVAMMRSKLVAQLETDFQSFQEENNWKYNLMTDPALVLAIPQRRVRFVTPPVDTMVAGTRRTLRGEVLTPAGALDTAFEGPVAVTVREPALRRGYEAECPGNVVINYLLPGGVMYEGTADATGGKFEVNFRVPRYASTGSLAHATAYARDGSRDAGEFIDSVLVVTAPTVEDSLALRPVDGAPRVDLGFKSGLKVVKPGDTVKAVVRDGDGINILATTNAGKQAVLIDNLPLPIDVNDFFSYDHGGTDTSGVLLFPLPDLDVGRHRLVYKVSDAFGFTTVDTLFFDVTDAADFFAEAVFNYPNPFKESTQFLFRVSDRASISLDIFTVSGKRVRGIDTVRDGGDVWIEWDGRDGAGGDVANGTYLYVASIKFVGVDRPPVVLRGKLSRIR